MQLLLSDALTGKSFDEISRTFLDFRVKEYTRQKLIYISAINYWNKLPKVKLYYYINLDSIYMCVINKLFR